MRTGFLLFCFTTFGTGLLAQAGTPTALARPKLVVGIAVDQMRWDYLYRYFNRYGEDGFKRLYNGGFRCEETYINYLPSYTGPGHACIWTGSVPAFHGIAGNTWINAQTGKTVYCVEDSSVRSIGGSRAAGRMSPRNLLSTTIGDELKLATNNRSRVFAISLKDRASILPAGHSADGVYWYDDSTGRFITSSFYADALPQWLLDFNARRLPDSFLQAGWRLGQDVKLYRHSTADSTRYEGLFRGERSPTFPHDGIVAAGLGAVRAVPGGNSLTLALARTLVQSERLGQGSDPDLLAINLASTDYAGHQYGPNALEMEDLYMKLDAELGAFLKFLDKTIGRNQYLFFLTADHGSAHNTRFLADRKIPGGLLTEEGLGKRLKTFAEKELDFAGGAKALLGLDNYQVYLNNAVLLENSADRHKVKAIIKQFLEVQEGIEAVYDIEAEGLTAPQPLRDMMLSGHHPQRSGSLAILTAPGWYAGYAATGTTHGTWHPYDTHIPLLWYGWKIPAGRSYTRVHMTDIAATVAALLHIQVPNASVGKPITEVLQ
jgi:predicted AlkP superfamily pyrophosphatase or phosphodiesterase